MKVNSWDYLNSYFFELCGSWVILLNFEEAGELGINPNFDTLCSIMVFQLWDESLKCFD